jgi:hypothetical protein
MPERVVKTWREGFFQEVECPEVSKTLKESALTQALADWTSALTAVVVSTCMRFGWQASAKAHKLELLPVQRSEYLGLDVVAFPDTSKRWLFPVEIMELENQLLDDAIAYSLSKLICGAQHGCASFSATDERPRKPAAFCDIWGRKL